MLRGAVRRDRGRAARRRPPRTAAASLGFLLGGLFIALGVGRLTLLRRARSRWPGSSGFERVLDAPALFSVAYGEIASSIYFALGIVAALRARADAGRPARRGRRSSCSSRSRTRRARPRSRRRAARRRSSAARSTTSLGFLTGWVLFLDYLIVIALSALFLPHYLGAALGLDGLRDSPWDVVVAVVRDRRDRRRSGSSGGRSCTRPGSSSPPSTSRPSSCSSSSASRSSSRPSADERDRRRRRADLGRARLRAPARDARVHGLETVANLAEETREPGRTLPRSLFSAIGLVVVITALIAAVGLSAFPVEDGETALGEEWL